MRTREEITAEIEALERCKPGVPMHRVLEIDTQIAFLKGGTVAKDWENDVAPEGWENDVAPVDRWAVCRVVEWLNGEDPASKYWANWADRNEATYLYIRTETRGNGLKLRKTLLLACSDAEALERGWALLGDPGAAKFVVHVVKIGS